MKKIIKILFLLLLIHFKTNGQNVILQFKSNSNSNNYNKEVVFENANLMYFFLNDTINKLHKKGYIDSEYILNKNEMGYEAEIIRKNLITKITINLDSDNRIKELLKEPFPITILYNDLDTKLNTWLNILEENGQGLAKLHLSNQHIIKDTLLCTLYYQADISRKINAITIEGYEKFPEGIKKDLNRKFKNLPLNTTNSEKLNQYIKQLHFINTTRPNEILFENNKTTTYIYVEKSKNNKFDGYIGFGTNEKKKLQLNGYLDLNLNNILNKGEETALLWRSDGNKQTTFDFKTELPYILKSPIAVNFNINLFKQDSTYQTTSLNYNLKYYYNYNTKFGIGYKSNTSTYTAEQTNNGTNYTAKFITLVFNKKIIDNSENIFKEKAQFNITTGIGKRTSEESSNQTFLEVNSHYLSKISNKSYLYFKNQIYYLKSDTYLVNELFRIGGATTLRGFNENSLQGNTIITLLTEYRYVINNSLYIHSVTDIAHIEDAIEKTKNNLYGIGFGFGLINKNIIVNINYVNSNNFNKNSRNNNYLINISINTLF